ncbi:MAG: DUF123 domain-containing protein [Candidatus Hermodarchaeota archaeon]
MNLNEILSPIIVLGTSSQAGSYILRIKVSEDLHLVFGRFKKGKMIHLPVGEYVYIGSALATKGAMSLALRLVRHATRSGKKPPHKIRSKMIQFFKNIELGKDNLLSRKAKNLYWNIDYLLDQMAAELTHVIIIRSHQKLEEKIGKILEREPFTVIIEKGLGANDISGSTHILRTEGDGNWWKVLIQKLDKLLGQL